MKMKGKAALRSEDGGQGPALFARLSKRGVDPGRLPQRRIRGRQPPMLILIPSAISCCWLTLWGSIFCAFCSC